MNHASRVMRMLNWRGGVLSGQPAIGAVDGAGVLAVLVFSLSAALSVCAQGSINVLQTGGGLPLVSYEQMLQTADLTAPAVAFDFGFATDQTPAPGELLDSFTVSFENAASNVAVVVTVDASGVVWAPTSPGAVLLSAAQIQRQAISPPGQSPILGQGVAYSVQVPVPAAFTNSPVTVYFDLFDNLNPAMAAMGWFQNLQVVQTPEPSAVVLLGAGLAVLLFKRR